MVFERITLLNIYDSLLQVETNEAKISSILINRVGERGTKTFPRFNSLVDLKAFIQKNYPFRKLENAECQCFTCNEGIANLLNFSINDGDSKIFVNNIRGGFESSKQPKLNGTSVKELQSLFNRQSEINSLFVSYVCNSYIDPQSTYWNPCEYTAFITNKYYHNLIDDYYNKTRRSDFPGIKKINC